MHIRLLNFICIISCTMLLQACSTLPKRQPVIATYSSEIDTSESTLAKTFAPLKAQHPNLTGYHILYEPTEALGARLQLIEKADKTLDLQYYIWDNDKVGTLALEALLRAADRGVKVRLLLDDNNTKNLEATYLAMTQHPNIQVRVFNPYRFRNFRALDILLNFNRITRRMHNKTFIADQEVALIGGRNMSNQYYDAGENFQFSDMDVMLVGDAVQDIESSFDEYWNHEYAYPIAQTMQNSRERLTYQSLRKQLEEHWFKSNVQNYLNILSSSLSFDTWFNENMKLEWVNAAVVKDSADKIKAHAPREEHLNFQMMNILDHPVQQVDLVSAYFVPDDDTRRLLKYFANNDVQIRILTNSFQANDVPLVHAFYAKYRKELLENGVQLYEFLAILPNNAEKADRKFFFGNPNNRKDGFSRSSLHAKFMALDQRQVFIGSFNFDPRSTYLNTEIGVILDSPTLANAIHSSMTRDIMKYSYQVDLDPNNNLIWKQEKDNKILIHTEEPNLSRLQKIGLKIISWLPIEGQM